MTVRKFRWSEGNGIDHVDGKSFRVQDGYRDKETIGWTLQMLEKYVNNTNDPLYEEGVTLTVKPRLQRVTTHVILFDGEVISRDELERLVNQGLDILDEVDE